LLYRNIGEGKKRREKEIPKSSNDLKGMPENYISEEQKCIIRSNSL